MKKNFALILIIFANISAFSQSYQNDQLYCIPHWQPHDRRVFNVKETVKITAALFSTFSVINNYKITVLIYDTSYNYYDTTKKYTIAWRIKTTSSENKDLEGYSLLAKMRDGLTIIYKTNETGDSIYVANLKDISAHLSFALDSLTKDKTYSDFDKTFIDLYRETCKTKEGILGIFLKPVSIFHTPYNNKLVLNDPIFKYHEAANSLGGKPFPAVNILELQKIDPENDLAKIQIDQIVEKGKAAEIMKDKLIEITKKLVKEDDNDELPDEILSNDHNEFSYELSTGWLNRIFYKRVTKMSGAREVDKIEFEPQ